MKHLDKLVHFLIVYLIADLGIQYLDLSMGCTIAVMAIFGREIYNALEDDNKFCWWDVLFGALGLILAVVTNLTQ